MVAILAAGVGFVLQRDASDEIATMRELQPLVLAEAEPGMRGWVEGVVAAPGQPLTAPVSGAPAAWWRTETVREWEAYDDCASRTAEGACKGRWRDASMAVDSATSPQPLQVSDGVGTISLAIDGEVADLDPSATDERPDPSHDTTLGAIVNQDGARRSSRLVTREWALREGDPVLGMGVVAADEAGNGLRLHPVEDLPVASASTWAERLASVAGRASIFGWIFYAGLAGLAAAVPMVIIGMLRSDPAE